MPVQPLRAGSRDGVTLLADSVSRSVRQRLPRQPRYGRVLAVFERAFVLQTPGSDLVAVVLPQIGNGPLNVVVDAQAADLTELEPGTPARIGKGTLAFGGMEISLSQAAIWEPCPNWKRLRAEHNAMTDLLPWVQAFALRHAPERSGLLALLPQRSRSFPPDLAMRSERSQLERQDYSGAPAASDAWPTLLQEAVVALQAGWAGDAARWREAGARLVGLGEGLTPSGDDLLAGVMLWTWLAHPAPQDVCQILLEAAIGRTTMLSVAFLRAAARGECNAAWHRFLDALADGERDQLSCAVQEVLSFGHTSGVDTLTGFLCLPLSGITQSGRALD